MQESQPAKTIRTRPAARLKAKLDRSLFAYAAAASAAGVGLLVLVPPAKAEIIYTKAHEYIDENSILPLDLNHDGITDFNFKNFANGTTHGPSTWLSVSPVGQGGGVWGHKSFRGTWASALYAGVSVGPKGQFLRGAGFMAQNSGGPWVNVTNRYLALKFIIKGKTHFGWARLNVNVNHGLTGLLTGYAYETVADRPIITGKEHGSYESGDSRSDASSGTLGRLAQGARRPDQH
jgi:hypothetical protein